MRYRWGLGAFNDMGFGFTHAGKKTGAHTLTIRLLRDIDFFFGVLKNKEKKDMAVYTRQDLFSLYLFLFHGMNESCLNTEVLGDTDRMALIDGCAVKGDEFS